jgi:hypothetical protein
MTCARALRSFLFSALAGGLAAGCVSVARPSFPIVDAGLAVTRAEAGVSGLRALRAEARVDQRGQRGRVRGTVLMFVERTPRVRFDVMTQFGPIAILTSDATRFAYSDLREKRYLTGLTCPKNIARLLGVPLSVEETARFLLGATPLLATGAQQVVWNADGFYRVTRRGSDAGRQELDLAVYPEDMALPAAQQRLYLLRSELYAASGKTTWRVTYDQHQSLHSGGTEVLAPYRVRVEEPASGSDTIIRFKEIVLNPKIPDQAFTQTLRAGMLQEEASCE